MTSKYVRGCDAGGFLHELENDSVDLLLTDPPYFGITDDAWDNQWTDEKHFARWLSGLFLDALPKLTPTGSLVFFGALGKHGAHPLFRIVTALEDGGYTFRNWVTWKKRRAYGKSHDYLYTREEILWFSRSAVRTQVTFNKPYTEELRGYDGYDPNYKALSEYKRVANVFADIDDPGTIIDTITELFRPQRSCQKPPKLMERLVNTHSDKGQLVIDPFSGWGSTGVSAVTLGRRFMGCEAIGEDAIKADQRIVAAAQPEEPDGDDALSFFQ